MASVKYEIEVVLEQWTAHNTIFRSLIRLTSFITFIYTTCFTKSDFWLLVNLLHLTTTAFWYSQLLWPRLSLSHRLLLSFFLVNFAIPYTFRSTISPPPPPPPLSNANLSTIRSLTQTQIHYKDSILATSIRTTELLWCKSMAAICYLDPYQPSNLSFLHEWTANATKPVNYSTILNGSKYALLESHSRPHLSCLPELFCRASKNDTTLATTFLHLAQTLNLLRWDMIHVVTEYQTVLEWKKSPPFSLPLPVFPPNVTIETTTTSIPHLNALLVDIAGNLSSPKAWQVWTDAEEQALEISRALEEMEEKKRFGDRGWGWGWVWWRGVVR